VEVEVEGNNVFEREKKEKACGKNNGKSESYFMHGSSRNVDGE
jgi:hypothetical protein